MTKASTKIIDGVIDGLEDLIIKVKTLINRLNTSELENKPAPDKWSRKEILGHMCDSAFNNMQRFIRVQYESKPYIVYDQDFWVKSMNYQAKPVNEILNLWISLHQQLIHVLKNFPHDKLLATVMTNEEVTAEFVITDYLDHQLHHFRQLQG